MWYWFPVVAYAGLIFFLSSLSYPERLAPSIFDMLGDKTLHAMEYGVLAVLCYRAFRHAAGPTGARHALGFAILAASLYGVTDEIHQAFVFNRESSGWDLLADTVGATVASVGWRWGVES